MFEFTSIFVTNQLLLSEKVDNVIFVEKSVEQSDQ